MAGTAKLLSASTKVSIAAKLKARRPSGHSSQRMNALPAKAGSASSWAGSSRCHAPNSIINVMGHSMSDKIKTVPFNE